MTAGLSKDDIEYRSSPGALAAWQGSYLILEELVLHPNRFVSAKDAVSVSYPANSKMIISGWELHVLHGIRFRLSSPENCRVQFITYAELEDLLWRRKISKL